MSIFVMDVNSSSSVLKSISDSVSLLLFELVRCKVVSPVNPSTVRSRTSICRLSMLHYHLPPITLPNRFLSKGDLQGRFGVGLVALVVDTSMEGGRGRFCDFDEDSSVGRGHDKFDDFFEFCCLKELSSLSSVIGSSEQRSARTTELAHYLSLLSLSIKKLEINQYV